VSFNIEQLGFGKGDAVPESQFKPPPLYPPLENRPIPLDDGLEQKYLLTVRKELNLRMQSSPFYLVTSDVTKKGIERYYDRFQKLSHLDKELPVQWNRMPSELQKAAEKKRKTVSSAKGVKKQKTDVDPNQILSKLEKKEKIESDTEDDPSEKKKVRDDDDDHDLNDGRDDIEEEEIDEELDEGTDYANQYFDNGESYLDEDDNLEDEAAYS